MNKDQAKGAIKEVAGKVQAEIGHAVGNPTQQLKGMAKQVEGHLQKKVGDVKQAVKERIDKA